MQATWDDLVTECDEAREKYYSSIGEKGDVITPMISYSLQGFPAWPVRDSWQIIQKPNTTIIMSDGLSSPYEDDLEHVGIEVAVENATKLDDFNAVTSSWAWELVFQASFFIADNPGIRAHYEGKRSATAEYFNVNAPEQYLTDQGTIGVLLTPGGKDIPARMALPTGEALVLVVTPLLREELRAVTGGDRAKAIDAILEELPKRGYFHYCHDTRQSVV